MDAEVLFVEDRKETDFILKEFTPEAEKSQRSEGAYLGYWLGIYNTSISDSGALSFYSDPDRPVSYLNFAQGEPRGENKCFSMNAKTGYWQGQGSILIRGSLMIRDNDEFGHQFLSVVNWYSDTHVHPSSDSSGVT